MSARRIRLPIVLAVAAALLAGASPAGAVPGKPDAAGKTGAVPGKPDAAGKTRYVTFAVGRGQLAEARDCQLAPGAVSLFVAAGYARARGVNMSANLIPGYLDKGLRQPRGRHCATSGTNLYLSWFDAALLRDAYGWSHSTSGAEYRVLSTLSRAEQTDEACGALPRLAARGHTRAAGLFAAAHPGGAPALDDTIVSEVVLPCGYTWARDYGGMSWASAPKRADGSRVATNVRGRMDARGYHRTLSVNGGGCPATWRCWAGGGREYLGAEDILRQIRDAPADSHTVVQFYRLAQGSVEGSHDCTDPAHRKTYTAELWCYEDLQAVLDGLPADVVVTDPLTVAEAWGLAPRRGKP